ncbi:MAG: NAD(+)/NADH kinase, partial [Nanoarchaeota archaeon]|nr:NAD(+)/NADH kinase [Nanoarchaeota archaeon]
MKVFLVYKRSQHDIYIEHDNPRLNWFIERHAKRYSESADQQHRTLDAVIKELGHQGISYEAVWRGDIKGQIAGVDAVVVVGGDGTFLEAARYCKGIPMVGVNSDSRPGGSQGFFSYFSIDNLADFGRFVDGQLPVTRMDRLRAELTDMFLDKTIVHDPLL